MPSVQNPYEFLRSFYSCAEQAQYRIYLQSMNFESGEVMDHLAPVLIEKAKKGVDVRIYADWVADRYVHDIISFFPALNKEKRIYAKELRQKNAMLKKQLITAGVKLVIINKPNPLSYVIPIVGRNHKKIYVVDAKAAWIGGVNLADHAFESIDCMVKLDDPSLIEPVAEELYLANEKNKKDRVKVLASDLQLVIDGGKRKSSLIYDTALAMVQSCQKKIMFISQFLPDGPLLDQLIKKHQLGIPVYIYTSPETHTSFQRLPYKAAFLATKKKLSLHGIIIHFLRKKVHAKILIVDSNKVLTGSHNLVNIGVHLGTEEIALYSSNPHLLGEFEKYYYQYIVKNDPESLFGSSLPFFI